jgi:F-type H+-transporting ATPase subunit delta
MIVTEVAKRYAKALYWAAKEKDQVDQVLSQLRSLSEAVKGDKQLSAGLLSPLISAEEKVKAVQAGLSGKVISEVLQFLVLLAEKKRLGSIPQIAQAFLQMVDADNNVTRGTVRAAHAISPDSLKKLEQKIEAVTGKKVILSFEKDPSLLGGLTAQVAGWTFDDSIESHLKRMSEELNRRTH